MSDSHKEWLSVRELADWLGITEVTVRRLMAKGELPYYTVGRSVRFRRPEIEEYLQRRRVGGCSPSDLQA